MNFTDALTNFLTDYRITIVVISIIVCFIPWLVILFLLHCFKIRELNEWAKPFAWGFFVLAMLHTIGWVQWLLGTPGRITHIYIIGASQSICSGLSNYFFYRVGTALTKGHKAFHSKILDVVNIRPFLRRTSTLVLFLSIASLISMLELYKGHDVRLWWIRIPDGVISIYVILFVGVALSRNISFRRSPVMASIALLTALFYGILLLSYAFHPLIVQSGRANWINVPPMQSNKQPEEGADQAKKQPEEVDQVKKKLTAEEEAAATRIYEEKRRTRVLDLTVSFLSIPLKLGLFFPAYVLMLLISSPARIRELYGKVTNGSVEFLDDNGVVRSMKEEIKASRIELYIKLPRKERNKAALYEFPPKVEITEKPEEVTFDETTDSGSVMSSGKRLLFHLLNYSNEVPNELGESLSPHSSVIVLPILFHDTVIGCLKAVLDEGKFTEADMQNMQRFASLLSPAVQDYREVDGLNEISRRLTRLQIEAKAYQISDGVKEITKITGDILASSATCISIEAGFHPYHAMSPAAAKAAPQMQLLLEAPYSELKPKIRVGEFNYLPEILEITSRDLTLDVVPDSKQFFGRYILKTPIKLDKSNLPMLATKPVHRRAVSNLITEALLNFVRGSLNEVSRELAVSLNGLVKAEESGEVEFKDVATVQRWFTMVEANAGKADLNWVVATHPKNKDQAWLGEEQELVRQLEEDQSGWVTKKVYTEYANIEAIALYRIDDEETRQHETTHVIRLSFRETKQQMWLGICNPHFSLELDYLSPWSGFIHRFGEIADTTLQQILKRQAREKSVQEEARRRQTDENRTERTSIAHSMVKVVRNVTGPVRRIVRVIKSLKGYETAKSMADGLIKAVPKLEKMVGDFSNVGKPNARRSCSLKEIVQCACTELRDELDTLKFEVVDEDKLGTYIVGVPLNVAKNALVVLLENAVDAKRDEDAEVSWIRVSANNDGDMIRFHVTDNGTGVPSHLLPHIIENEVVSTKTYGSGIGLSQCADSLRQYGSDIKLTCPGPAPHTTFTLCFSPSRED